MEGLRAWKSAFICCADSEYGESGKVLVYGVGASKYWFLNGRWKSAGEGVEIEYGRLSKNEGSVGAGEGKSVGCKCCTDSEC